VAVDAVRAVDGSPLLQYRVTGRRGGHLAPGAAGTERAKRGNDGQHGGHRERRRSSPAPDLPAGIEVIATSGGHTAPMGFDPTRKHKRSSFDYWFVGLGIVVVIGMLVWAVA
jgi:hypothetical protein